MAYDFDAAYQPPPRPYLSQRPQSPQVSYRQPEQTGYHSVPAAHDDYLYNGSGPNGQPLVNGHHALDERNGNPSATQVAPYDRRPGPEQHGSKDTPRRRAASRAGGQRRPLVEPPATVAMSQDNAFPIFPSKKAVAQQAPKPRDDQSRSRPSTANGRRNAPERAPHPDQPRDRERERERERDHSRPSTSNGKHHGAARPQSPPHHTPRPSTSDRPDSHALPRGHNQRDVYQSPPRKPHPPIAQFPTFSPPYSQSSRPSTSESTTGRDRPYLAPLDTHVANDPHVVESPQLSTVRARHSPAIVPNPHVPEATHAQAAHISQSAHLSQVSAYNDFLPIQNPTVDQHAYEDHYSQQASRGDRGADRRVDQNVYHDHHPQQHSRDDRRVNAGVDQHVYDDHYSPQPPRVDRKAERELEIEAEMPNFNNAGHSTVHKRQLTIDDHLNNLQINDAAPAPAPQPQPTYQTASSKLKSAKSQPNLRQRSPAQGNTDVGFDFGFGGQPISRSPEPQYHPSASPQPSHGAQGRYYQPPPPSGQQRSASYEVQTPDQAMSPPVPQHSFTYDDYGGSAHNTNPYPGHGYDEPVAGSPRQHDYGYDGQGQGQGQGLMPPQNQQRSYSYDDPRPIPSRPPPQQRALTYDDQGLYNRQPPHGQYPVPTPENMPISNGRTPKGPISRGPPPNGPMPGGPVPGGPMPGRPMPGRTMPGGPMPGGPMPGGPIPGGPMPGGPMPGGSIPGRPLPGGPMPRGPPRRGPMPPGPMPNDPSRRGPMPPRPMPPGSAPRGPMNQSRRPPPGEPGYGPGPGMRSMDGRAPVQRHASDNRAPSAPATQGGFAPPPPGQAQYGYGPDMNSRTPMQRYPSDGRAPTAPPTQNGFAPPPESDRSFGRPTQRYAPDGRAPTAPPTQNGFAPPAQSNHSYGAPMESYPIESRAPSAPPIQNGFAPTPQSDRSYHTPTQGYPPDGRAPTAPPTQNGFAPTPQIDSSFGPPMQGYPPDSRAPSAPPVQNGFAPTPQSDRSFGPPMQGYPPDSRAPSAPATRGGYGLPPPPESSFGAPLAQQRSAPQTRPGAQQQTRSNNPDPLPSHPVPVRPGLTNPPVSHAPKPVPVRHYAGTPDSTPKPQPQSQPANNRASVESKRDIGPVTLAELDSLRTKVDASPSDNKTALHLAKRLVEAATVLASEGGLLDARATAKNRERYVLEAHKRVKKLVAAGYSDATFYLADCYGSGELGLDEDAKQAFSLYQTAAKAGHGAAAYRTAVCCELGAEEGGGTKRDYTKAVQWYQRAAQLQDVAAMYKMGIILLRGLLEQQRNVRQAVTYLKRAAEYADANNPHALHELARLHEEGNPDPLIREAVVPDEKYSQKLYTQAAKLGYKTSQFRLGQAFEYGSLGLPVDSRNSIAWYSKAAAQGEHNSELALSGWYLTGADGILGQSDTEAYLWARKAATSEPPLAKAMYALAYYIENGIGCAASLEEAKRWYGRAASYKFPKAIERLEEIRRGKASKPVPPAGRLTRRDQKRDEAECVVM